MAAGQPFALRNRLWLVALTIAPNHPIYVETPSSRRIVSQDRDASTASQPRLAASTGEKVRRLPSAGGGGCPRCDAYQASPESGNPLGPKIKTHYVVTGAHAAHRPRWLRKRLASQAHGSWPPQPRKSSRPAGHASVPATLVRTTSKPQSCDRGSLPESASLMFFPVQKASQWRVNWSESHPSEPSETQTCRAARQPAS